MELASFRKQLAANTVSNMRPVAGHEQVQKQGLVGRVGRVGPVGPVGPVVLVGFVELVGLVGLVGL